MVHSATALGWRKTTQEETLLSNANLISLDAYELAARMARRELTSVDLVRACLERMAIRDPQIHAFTQTNPDRALARARELDNGPVRGILHGLPIGVKDLFDTAEFTTTYGSAVYAHHQPPADAAAVALCDEAGALVVGKTVSTELAYFMPGPTCNPHNLAHTPGGSSSGSAAAVADFMVPLALGTQTAGSIIRPAAFCGVVGYKPSLGRIAGAGVKSLSPTLDVVGGFGRSVRDVGLLGAVLTGDSRMARLDHPVSPRIGLFQTPHWSEVDSDTQEAWLLAVRALAANSDNCTDVVMPQDFGGLLELQKQVMAFEMARSLSHERLHHRSRLSDRLLALLDEGMAMKGETHIANLEITADWRLRIDALFERHDVLMAPSAIGEAPHGIQATGDPIFCRSWTLLGLPSVHLPFAKGRNGLPVGMQLVGRHGDDHKLLACAQWVHQRLLSEV